MRRAKTLAASVYAAETKNLPGSEMTLTPELTGKSLASEDRMT
jgi:hypothetical protein